MHEGQSDYGSTEEATEASNREQRFSVDVNHHGLAATLSTGNLTMNEQNYADVAMAELLRRAKKQFGDAVKGFWFYNGDPVLAVGFQ